MTKIIWHRFVLSVIFHTASLNAVHYFVQPSCHKKCWQCAFLQTTGMLKLYIPSRYIRQRLERSHFGFKSLFLSPQTWLENVPTSKCPVVSCKCRKGVSCPYTCNVNLTYCRNVNMVAIVM